MEDHHPAEQLQQTLRPISMEASTPNTVTLGHSHDRFQVLPKWIIPCPACNGPGKLCSMWDQELHSNQPLYKGPGGSALRNSSHTTWLPWLSLGPRPRLPTPSATLALGHLSPTLALATYPSYGRADQQGGQQWPRGQQANPTQKSREAICCPSSSLGL